MRLSAHHCPPLDAGPKRPQTHSLSERFPPHLDTSTGQTGFWAGSPYQVCPPCPLAASIESMKPGKARGTGPLGLLASWVQAGAPGTTVTMNISIPIRAHPCSEPRTAVALTVWGRQPRTAPRGGKLQEEEFKNHPSFLCVSTTEPSSSGKRQRRGKRNAGTAKPCG